MSPPKTALVTGANGYIGSAVARAFSNAGYKTYGLVRRPENAPVLAASEVTPIIGSAADLSFLSTLLAKSKTFDIIVSTTEDLSNYIGHMNDSVSLFRSIADSSTRNGVRPLVIFTSGCKDYGMTALDGDPNLQPHTELSPLYLGTFLRPRTVNATKIFDHADVFDAVVTRPTTLYGFSSSYYAAFFQAASEAAKTGKEGGDGVLRFPSDGKNIMHGTHVSDCGTAYVAIAEAAREVTKGQVYNISSRRYETAMEVGEALKNRFDGIKKVSYTPGGKYQEGKSEEDLMMMIGTGWSQWVGSDKLRNDTGWTDVKPLFSEDIDTYRLAYEATKEERDSVKKVLGYAQNSGH